MSLQRREDLSVSNEVSDNDHKYLIELINETEANIQKRYRPEVSDALDKLAMYSKFHFSREEKIAGAVGYGQVAQMHESHAQLMLKLDAVRVENEEQWSDVSMDEFGVFLQDWLINHVIKEDMLLKPYLEKFSTGFNPK